MKTNIKEFIIPIIRKSLQECGAQKEECQEIILDFSSDSRFGDLSTSIALKLAKSLKKAPPVIAASLISSIKNSIQGSTLKEYIREVKAEGAGFINFYLDDRYFQEETAEIIAKGKESLRVDVGKGRPVLIEFVSANPTGSLSVAHARQAAVGDCLANVLDFMGFRIHREYYLNDEGNQINILGRSVELRGRELAGEKIDFPENYYQGDYIYEIAKEAKTRAIDAAGLGDYAGEYILNIIKRELDDFGVKFDCWYSQKALAKSGKIEAGFDFLKKKGLLFEEEGALWFKSTAFGDDKDRVVIKSDGSQTYLAPDIAYHQEKFNRGYSWLINLWGPDHHGYIPRIKAAVQAFGHPADSLSVVIVQLATIFRAGKPVQMSTRKGQYITLQEVLDEVGKDAARYFFIMRRTSSHLDFDLEIAKKQTSENPVYYVQYAHARINSILNNSPVKAEQNADLSLLKEKEELALMKKALQFHAVLATCLATVDPYMLTVYLQELAEAFHKFYDLHRVLGDDVRLTQARLSLISATKIVIAAGLDLLGVSKPEKM